MPADLHLHVLPDYLPEEMLAIFFANTLGSKHFAPAPGGPSIEIYQLAS